MKKHLILLLAVAAVLSMALSCSHGPQNAETWSEADSLISAAWNAADYERVIVIADSLEQVGDISAIRSAYLRGKVYRLQNNFRLAKEILQPAIDMKPTNTQDSTYYIYSALNLAEVLSLKNDYEGVLRVAFPVVG